MTNTLTISGRSIGDGHPAYVIAEIGINHNGDPTLFRRLLRAVKNAGADAVKVQIIDAAKSYTRSSPSYELFKRVEFDQETWRALMADAREMGLAMFSTFTEISALRLVEEFDLPAVKVSSSNVTNIPLIRAIAATRKPVIMSTGLSYLSEVDEAVRELESHGCTQLAILQCTSLYPTAPQDVNLRTFVTLRHAFSYPIGFSDHTTGTTCAIAAVALGARIIEKHVTLDRALPGPDHHFSATPEEFAVLVRSIRDVESALGIPRKQPAPREFPERAKMQRVLVTARSIAAGEIFTAENVVTKRSGVDGLAPRAYDTIIGQRAARAIPADATITFDAVAWAHAEPVRVRS
ncbi:N-acetylneuraminate synthase family protein [Candidatus Uhrbacteria bacterium]|nr:N-acetylneuraminate synthase family protein [Candidatus Uhrbacteria bacterium]